MPDSPRPPAIVTAMNANGLAVARALGRRGVSVIGIGGGEGDEAFRSRFLDQLWRSGPGPDGLLTLLRAKGPTMDSRPVLIPITDESVLLIAEHLDELRRWYRVGMPSPGLVRDLADKGRMHAIAERAGVVVPRTWEVSGEESFRRARAEVTLPCILKPAGKETAWEAAGLEKAYICDDLAALDEVWHRVGRPSPSRVVIQPFVPGGDDRIFFTLLYCRADGQAAAVFSGRKLRQWPPGYGGTSACEPVDCERIESMAREFFATIGMHGLCSLEYKQDPRDGSYYMIEPTVCRPDRQSDLAEANGVPLALIAYCDLAGVSLPAVKRPRRPRRWVCLARDRRAAACQRRRGKLGWLSWLWSIRPPVRGAVFAFDDPRPWLGAVGRSWRGMTSRLVKREKRKDAWAR